MTGQDVFNFRKRKGLEKKQLAFLMGVHPRTVYNMEHSVSDIKDDYIFMIMELDNMIPDIKIVLEERLRELRNNNHKIHRIIWLNEKRLKGRYWQQINIQLILKNVRGVGNLTNGKNNHNK